jgi:hypothetical protein
VTVSAGGFYFDLPPALSFLSLSGFYAVLKTHHFSQRIPEKRRFFFSLLVTLPVPLIFFYANDYYS